ncbi:hypothetical protein DH2020_024475 [Rehmannia glutinosa]|uniref:Ionotropic glutamate receptor C-terminal domain-containing protein n=1 Tax=Rehmannia glutinosa TaxID=99300 RepID=A0ABR0W2A3_REHGL
MPERHCCIDLDIFLVGSVRFSDYSMERPAGSQFLKFIQCSTSKGFAADHGDKIIANIGVIVDMGSWEGKLLFIAALVRHLVGLCIPIAEVLALDLLENVELHAIIIPKISNEELFLARLGDKVNVPLLSFSSISSSSEHPYFIQVGDDENNQFHGIAAFLETFRWRSFVFLYEDTVDARQAQTYIHDILKENHLDVAYQSAISLQATDDQIINEFQTLVMMEASIIMVHLSPSLASRVFINARMLGMISKGYAWIVTSKTMNLLDSQNASVYEELNVFGVWAYDASWVLAEAIERAGIKPSQKWAARVGSKQLDLARLRVSDSGSAILSNITSSNFAGLVGKFQRTNRKLVFETYEILNLIGKEERRVGFWTSAHGLMKEINPAINSSSKILETIIWPGLFSTTPESWLVHMSGKSFRIGIPANARFSELLSLGHDWRHNITTFSGFCIDVFHAAVDRLPYKIAIEYIPFYKHYGTYNDLLYQVHLQNYNADAGDITIMSNMSTYVDFTVPYTESGEKLQSNVSRFVMGVWLFVVLILTSSYIAKLSSLLTIEQFKLTKTDYIGYPGNSFVRGISVSNLNFKDNRLIHFQTLEDYDEDLRKRSKRGGIGAITDELPYLKLFLARLSQKVHHWSVISQEQFVNLEKKRVGQRETDIQFEALVLMIEAKFGRVLVMLVK